MPIRRLTIHACLTGIALTSSTLVSANTALWKGSYAADGQCFCAGSLGQEIDSQIIPTPVGGQSVAQVCERIGSGPELQMVNGKFNFTVYPDYQCGHESASATSAQAQCVGNLGVSGEDCQGLGPKWDLKSVYSNNKPVELGISDTPSSADLPRYITPPQQSAEAKTESVETSNKLNTSEYGMAGHTPVEEIAKLRQSSEKITSAKNPTPAAPQTPEQIRARQLEQMAAARERAKLKMAEEQTTPAQETAKSVEAAAAVVADASDKEKTLADDNLASAAAEAEAEPSIAAASEAPVVAPTQLSAMQFPVSLKRGSGEFDFVEAAPVRYDFGGAGLRVTASKSSHDLLQYVLRASLADNYQEVALGMGLFVSPENMPRATMMLSAGLESGRHKFEEDELSTKLSDTGVYMQLASRFALTSKLRLQTGVNYSSFFEGDLVGFGEALFNINNNLDLSTRVEAGDKDSFGFGIRYHY